jgi:LAO/AO transport system kinase
VALMAEPAELSALATALISGDRRALARAITLVESERDADAAEADSLLDAVLPRTGNALRLGVTGPPGAGKSTLIDALGRELLVRGERVAVLAIDPSSRVSGGSVLGDKTRMARLSADARSFIRPTPARGAAGGVARHTREAQLLCEAAGYTVVIVETVGVGQGELAASNLSDCLLLVLHPGAGDELQGMKRGILELADVIALNKADSERERAEAAAAELTRALALFARHGTFADPVVVVTSALSGLGVPELCSALATRVSAERESGVLARRRRDSLRSWLHEELEALLRERLRRANLASELTELEEAVESSRLTPRRAARRFLELTRLDARGA